MSETGIHHEEEALGKAYDGRLMRRLLTYLRPYRLHVVSAIAVLMLASAMEIVGPWLTQQAIDRAIPAGDVGLLGKLAHGPGPGHELFGRCVISGGGGDPDEFAELLLGHGEDLSRLFRCIHIRSLHGK